MYRQSDKQMKKVIINSKALLKALQQNAKCINKSTPLPVCENYLIEVLPGIMRISTTDLEQSVINKVPCEAMEAFSFIMPGEVSKWLSKCDEFPLLIAYNEKNQHIIMEGEGEKAKYSGNDAGEFPVIPTVQINATIDVSSIGAFLPFCGTDELRPVMSGVNVDIRPESIRLVAANARILKMAEVKGEAIEGAKSFIVPAKTVKLLNDFKAGNVRYGITTTKEGYTYGRFDVNHELSIIFRPIDGRYPNYEAVIPPAEMQTTFLKAPVKEMQKVIDKAALFANTTTNMVKINMNGSVTISAEDREYDKEFSKVVPFEKTGNDLEIAFNHKFMPRILKDVSGPDITLQMSLPNRAITIREGSVTWLIMPVMLSA